jgi:hypothetical protein
LKMNTGNPQDRARKSGENPPDDEAIAPTQDERSQPEDAGAGSVDAADGRSKPDALVNRQWIHESGYGGKGGEVRVSSEQREASEHTVHTSEWPEFSADMLPAGTGPVPKVKPHKDEPHISDKPQK